MLGIKVKWWYNLPGAFGTGLTTYWTCFFLFTPYTAQLCVIYLSLGAYNLQSYQIEVVFAVSERKISTEILSS